MTNSLALLQGLKRGLASLAAVALIMAVLFGLTLGFSLLAFQLIGYAALCMLMLLFFWIMAEAGYKIYLRPLIRAWRIRKIRHKRLRLEAAARPESGIE